MFDKLSELLKYLVNLTPTKRLVAMSIVFLMLFATVIYFKDKEIKSSQLEFKVRLLNQEHNCIEELALRNRSNDSLKDIIFRLKIDSAVYVSSSQIKQARGLVQEAKAINKSVNQSLNNVNNTLNKISNQ